LSWRISKKKKISFEYGWTGNMHRLDQNLDEALPYFESEIGDRKIL
jgi:hypothetical protein